ncbi:MAG: RNA polymerase sigma factor [Planctomycetota bacterium]
MRRASPAPSPAEEDLRWARALAAQLTGSSHAYDADDLVQETYLRAIRNPAPAHLGSRRWLGGIMRKVWLQFRRQHVHRLDRECAYATERGIEQAAPRDEVLGELVTHVDAIAPEFGRALRLRYVDGLTIPELAEREGLTVTAAKARLRRAHDRLRVRVDRRPASLCAAWLAARSEASAGSTTGAARSVRPRAALGLKAAAVVGAVSLVAWTVTSHAGGAAGVPGGGRVVRAADAGRADVQPANLARVGGARVALESASSVASPTGTEDLARAEAADGARVVVVGPDGAPVDGVPVALIALRPRSNYVWRGNTGPDGESAVVPRGVLDHALIEGDARGLFAGIDAPQENAALVRVDGSWTEAGRVELPLPARTETIRIRPETRYGAAPARGTDVKVLVQPAGERRPCFVFRAWVPPGESIEIPFATPDVALTVQGRSAPRWARTTVRVGGPRPSGGTTEVRLVLDNERAQLRFLPRDRRASELEAHAVLTPRDGDAEGPGRFRFKGDGSGGLRASIPRARLDAARSLDLVFTVPGASSESRSIPLPVQSVGGVVDLGAIDVTTTVEAAEGSTSVGADEGYVVALGRVLVPPGVDLAAVLVELRPSGAMDADRISTTWTGPDGAYRLRARAPGSYEVVFRSAIRGEPMWILDDVLSGGGPNAAPTELPTVDLRGCWIPPQQR